MLTNRTTIKDCHSYFPRRGIYLSIQSGIKAYPPCGTASLSGGNSLFRYYARTSSSLGRSCVTREERRHVFRGMGGGGWMRAVCTWVEQLPRCNKVQWPKLRRKLEITLNPPLPPHPTRPPGAHTYRTSHTMAYSTSSKNRTFNP
jgi:hypothetical protein